MRIAYLSCDRGISVRGCNGAATHIRELVNALADRGAELLTTRPDAGGPEPLAAELIDVDTDAFLRRLRRRTARAEG